MTSSGYAARAGWYAAEIAGAAVPALLGGLLRAGMRVAEMPSGTGHFLPAYAAAGASVTLVDACADMLDAARRHAAQLQIRSLQTVCCEIENPPPELGPVDIVVIPNAAFNQLAANADPAELLEAAARILEPGGLLLLQVLRVADDGTAGPCGFYDPAAADGTWTADRAFTDDLGGHLVRRRRQHHDGTLLRIEFQLIRDGTSQYTHQVALRLLGNLECTAAVARAGLALSGTCCGAGGMDEVLARRQGRVP